MTSSYLSHRTRVHLTLWAPLGVLICLLLAACGGTSSTSSTGGTTTTSATTIAMDTSSFSDTTNVTIKAGQTVTFTSQGTHKLVIGMHGQFSAMSGAPSELNSKDGVSFSPSDSKTITFPTAGTYPITCVFHPSMQATVVVTS